MLRWDFQASFCRFGPGVGGRDVKLRWGRRRISMVGRMGNGFDVVIGGVGCMRERLGQPKP